MEIRGTRRIEEGEKRRKERERLRVKRNRERRGHGESKRGERCRWILTASATVSLEFFLLFPPPSGTACSADFELRLLHGPTEHEMGPAQHRVPVQARGTTALGAGVFQPFFLQPDSFFFRGQGDWFQPELAVIAAQHARLKHETHYRVTSSLCSGFAGRPSVARSIQRRVRIRREARTQIPLLGLSFSKELFAEWLNFFFFFFDCLTRLKRNICIMKMM